MGGSSRIRFSDSLFPAVEVFNHARDVGASLRVWGHSAKLLDPLRPRVVGGQRFERIALVTVQQLAQVFRACVHVGGRIPDVADPEAGRGSRYQLHEPRSALGRHSLGVETTFRSYYAGDKVRIDAVAGGGRGDQALNRIVNRSRPTPRCFVNARGCDGRVRRRIFRRLEALDLIARDLDVPCIAAIANPVPFLSSSVCSKFGKTPLATITL